MPFQQPLSPELEAEAQELVARLRPRAEEVDHVVGEGAAHAAGVALSVVHLGCGDARAVVARVGERVPVDRLWRDHPSTCFCATRLPKSPRPRKSERPFAAANSRTAI